LAGSTFYFAISIDEFTKLLERLFRMYLTS
jgi:hypothetical protein